MRMNVDMMWNRCKALQAGSPAWAYSAVLAGMLAMVWSAAVGLSAQAAEETPKNIDEQTAEQLLEELDKQMADPEIMRQFEEQQRKAESERERRRAEYEKRRREAQERRGAEAGRRPTVRTPVDRADTPARPPTVRRRSDRAVPGGPTTRPAGKRPIRRPSGAEMPPVPDEAAAQGELPEETPPVREPADMNIDANELPDVSDAELERLARKFRDADGKKSPASEQADSPSAPAESAPPVAAPSEPQRSNAPKDATTPKDSRTGLPDLKAKPKWWTLAPEDRPYFFSWKNTSFDNACRDLEEISGLSMVGLNTLDPKPNKPITFQSVKIMTYDEAILTFNVLIQDMNCWLLRRDNYLEVRNLSEWSRHIQPAKMFPTVEAYRQAGLPGWELASVVYACKEKPAQVLQGMVLASVPVNTTWVTVVPNANQLEIKSFVYYLDRQLDYLAKVDRDSGGDGRDLKIYSLEHATPEDAANLLRSMLPPEESASTAATPTPATPTRSHSRSRTPTPTPKAAVDLGGGAAESVEILPDNRLNRLLIRATPSKHEKIAELLEKYIDLPLEAGRSELIQLKHGNPSEMVEMIRPMLGEQKVIQAPTPTPRPGKPTPPTPAPRIINVGTTAVLTPVEHMRAILVKAKPDEMTQIKELVTALDVPQEDSGNVYVSLENASASNVASILTNAMGGRRISRGSTQQQFRAVADIITDKALILIGEPLEVEEAKTLIAKLDVDPEAGAKEHMVRLKNAEPSAVVGILQTRFGGGSARSVYSRSRSPMGGGSLPRFIPEDASKMLIIVCLDEDWPDIERLMTEIDASSEQMAITRTYRLKYAGAPTLANVLSQSLGGGRSASRSRYYGASSSGPMFQYEATSNVLLVTADEETHAKVVDLIAQLDQPSPTDAAELRVIQLETADAAYVVGKLTELFGSSSRSRSYGRSGGAPDVPVQIVAESVSNRVLITSSEEDFKKAESLAKQIDEDYAARKFVRKTFMLENALPSQVRATIQTMFTSESGSSSRYSRSASTPGSIRISEVGQGLVVLAPADEMVEIEKLVATLDEDPASDNEIRTYRVENVDSSGTANIARNLDQLYAVSASRRGPQSGAVRFIGNYGSDVLLVSAPTEKMKDIDGIVQELLKAQGRQDTSLVIRHYTLKHARPAEITEMVNPILREKYQELQRKSGSRSYSYGGGAEITPHKSGSKIMVSAPESLIPLVEELVTEFDQPAEASTMVIVALEKAQAEEIAPIVQQQMSEGGASTPIYHSSRSRYSRRYSAPSTSGSDSEALSVTPVMSSNLIILRGYEDKVAEAQRLIAMLDTQARPDGPMIKTYEIKHADLYDVVATLEEIVGSGGGMTMSRGGVAAPVIIQSDMYSNKLIVSAPYDKIPIVDQIVELKESLAYRPEAELADAGRRGEVLSRSSNELTKSYDVDGSSDDIAEYLDKILIDRLGYMEAPYVKSFPFANQVIVTGKPEHFKEVEKWLEKLEERKLPRRVGLIFKQVKSGNAGKVVEMLQAYAPAELQDKINVEAMPQLRGQRNPMEAIKEVNWDDPVKAAPASPFVGDGLIGELEASLAALSWAKGAKITVASQPATQPAEAPAAKVQPAPQARPAAPTTQPVAKVPAPAPKATTQPAPQAAPKAPAVQPKVTAAAPEAAAPKEPGQPSTPGLSQEEIARKEIEKATVQAYTTQETQIKYDEEAGLIYVIGPVPDLEKIQEVMDSVVEQFEGIEDQVQSGIRVFQLQHVDVTIAAAILEQMFNEKVAAKASAKTPAAKKSTKANKAAPEAEDEEGVGGRRRRAEEERAESEQAQAKRMAGGERIRIFPNTRDQTLVVRAADEDFPLVAELLLKIDRPSDRPPVKIQIIQLKRLNAYEVEQAIKAVLRIQDVSGRMPTRRTTTPARGGATAAGTVAMIEQLQQQMVEMQAMAEMEGGEEGTTKLNPAKDITLTSDATTNSIMVMAPAEGMKLVEKLIDDLEAQDIPTQIETFTLKHADAENVAIELQKVFASSGSARRASTKGGNGVKPSDLGNITIAADSRTNTIMVRALKTDMEKVEPIIAELDVEPTFEQQVQTYPIEHGDAAKLAQTLTKIFVQDPTATGQRAVRISADTETNTILVWAPEAQQKAIGVRIAELENRVEAATMPREIPLTFAAASDVAKKLSAMFAGKRAGSKAAAGRIHIEGDDASGALFVSAPDEVFNKIQEVARMMDQAPTQTIEVYALQHASATEVLARFKEMMGQVLVQGKGKGLGVFAATADERTNALVVAGNPATHLAVKDVLKQLDAEPSGATEVTTQMFTLARGSAASVANTINSLYRGKNWDNGMPAPKAAAEASANVVYVTGTKAQIAHIKKSVIDPLIGYTPVTTPTIPILDYAVDLKFAKADELAPKLTAWFKQKFDAQRRAGNVGIPPAETTVSIMAEPSTNRLLISSTENNKKVVEDLIVSLDVEGITDLGQKTEVIPVKYADLGYTSQALNLAFKKTGRVPASEQVTITPEVGTKSLIVKAPPEEMDQIKALLAQIDRSDATEITPPETVTLTNAQASTVARMLDAMIKRSKRRDRTTGVYPVTVSADDTLNTILISASDAKDMQEIKDLIAQLDVAAPVETARDVQTYPLKYADIGSAMQAIKARFADNAKRPVQDQVSVAPDYANYALMITASAANHEKVAKIIADMDVSNVARALTPKTIKVTNAKASTVANLLNEMIRRSKKRDRKTQMYPITVSADDSTNTLLVTANEEDMAEAEALIAQLDVPPPVEEDRTVRTYPLKYADITSAVQAITARFADNVKLPVRDQVSVAADWANYALMITASEANHEKVAKIVADLDVSNMARALTPKTIKVANAKASTVANLLNEMIRRSKKRDRKTQMYPITVSADDSTNTLLVTANEEDMAEAEALIAQLDVPPPVEEDRTVRTYPLKYADISSTVQAVNTRFADNAKLPVRDQVSVAADWGNYAIMVTASPANHEKVAAIIENLDKSNLDRLLVPETVTVQNAKASVLARTLTEMVQRTKKRDRRTGTYPVTVTANDATNSLVITANTADLEEMKTLIAKLDVPAVAEDDRLVKPYPIQYADVNSVVRIITSRFGDNNTLGPKDQVLAVPEASTNSVVVTASAENQEKIAALVAEIDVSGLAMRKNFPLEIANGDASEIARTLTTVYNNAMPRTRTGRVPAVFTAAPGSNKVVVTCTETELPEVKALVDDLDKAAGVENLDMRVVPVQRVTPQEMAKILTEFLSKPGSRGGTGLKDNVRVTPSVSAGTVVLTGPSDRLDELEQFALKIDSAASEDTARSVKVFELANGNASIVASAIIRSFTKSGAVPEAERVMAVADSTVNSVIVTANAQKMEAIAAMIDQLDKSSGNTPQQEIVRLTNARADELARVLTTTYRSKRPRPGQSPASITADANSNAIVISAVAEDMAAIKELVAQLDKPMDEENVEELRVIPLAFADAMETREILSEYLRKPGTRAGRGGTAELVGDIRIQASPSMNTLIVSGSSAEIGRVQKLVQTMDREDLGGAASAPQIIPLKYASASQLATTLSRMFTEPAQRSRGRTQPETVPLILADDTTNALVVRARSVDYNLIKETVAKLDAESEGPSGMELIPVSRNVDVRTLAREIERTINAGESYKARQQQGYRPAQVAIGVDERTPALLVAGSPEMFDTVKKLVAKLQSLKQEGAYTARIIPVRNIPPDDMKRVIEQLIQQQQGGSTGSSSRRR